MRSNGHKSARACLQRTLRGPIAFFVLAFSSASVDAQTLSARIDNAHLTANQCMTPWIDGTQVCRSKSVNGFSLLTFNHPDHKRWVIQYENTGLRVNDGGTVRRSAGYSVGILLDGQEIKDYDIAYQSMGQEWSHEEGARKRIRTPADLEARGDIPKHTRPQRYGASGLEDVPKPDMGAQAPYKPLHNGPLTAWMPAQGGHQEVHWTTGLALWAIYPDDPAITGPAADLIKVSAESFAGFPIFLTQKGAHHPIDLRAPYYADSAFDDARWATGGNEVEFDNGAPVQPGETERGMYADAAHLACPGWEQFLLDGDPYHLRALHFCGTWGIGWTGNGYRKQGSIDGKAALVPNRDQPRSWAKVLMLLWRAHEYTPEGTWEWLLPKSYWAQSLKDSEHQAETFLAKFPNSKAGRIQIDYARYNDPDTAPYEGISHLNHQHVQSLWTAGWMVAKGYEGFRPLYDNLAGGFTDALNALGAPLVSVSKDIDNARKTIMFETWAEAGEWLPENVGWPIGPGYPSYSHIWAEERFEGVFTSLNQLGFSEMAPLASIMRDSRLLLSKCLSQKQRGLAQDAVCPTWGIGFSDISPDWSFGLGNEAKTKAAAKDILEPSRHGEPKKDTAPASKPSQPAPPKRQPATQLETLEPRPAEPQDNLPAAGKTTLPDPGIVNFPDPGKVTLP